MRDKVLALAFIFQALFNVYLTGFPGFMVVDVFIPEDLYRSLAWTGPYLVLIYFLLGMASLFYLSIPGKAGRARFLGHAYFGIGALGGLLLLWKLLSSGKFEWFIAGLSLAWIGASVVGTIAIMKVEGLPLWLSALAGVLLLISALFSTWVARWMVEDYYAHVDVLFGGNYTSSVETPEWVSG